MPFTKSSSSPGKKQTPMPGPNSAAYKKLLAADAKSSPAHANLKGASPQPGKKPSPSFSSLKTRQRIVERVKRTIWASVVNINDAIIKLALAGNYNAAKALFDFAGVYSLPDSEPAVAAATPAPVVDGDHPPLNPIDAFFHSIGVKPPSAEPQPDMALQSL
jgi:hypothetical protein